MLGYAIVSIFIFGLSPVLKTLMKSISTDTIYAMTVRIHFTISLLELFKKHKFSLLAIKFNLKNKRKKLKQRNFTLIAFLFFFKTFMFLCNLFFHDYGVDVAM